MKIQERVVAMKDLAYCVGICPPVMVSISAWGKYYGLNQPVVVMVSDNHLSS